MQIKVTAASKALVRKMNGLNIEAVVDAAVEAVAREGLSMLKVSIDGASFPVSPAWAATKARLGLSSKSLHATGAYSQSLRVGRTGRSSWGISALDPLYLFLDQGTSRMGPRPHWERMMKTMERRAPTLFKEALRRALS